MGQAIQQGRRKRVTAKYLHPVREFEIGRDDERDMVMQTRAKLEQELGATRGKRDEAEFVQDNEPLFTRSRDEMLGLMLILG